MKLSCFKLFEAGIIDAYRNPVKKKIRSIFINNFVYFYPILSKKIILILKF